MKIGFIGCGNMANAMIHGMIASHNFDKESFLVSNRSQEKLDKIHSDLGIATTTSNEDVAKVSDVLVLSVKPQVYEKVIAQIKDLVKDTVLILTIAPGFTLDRLEKAFGRTLKIVRCIPNTPAQVSEGMTAYVCNGACRQEEMTLVEKILNSFGKCASVQENQMDAVTAVSGSSPAYVYVFIETMANAAVKEGMPMDMAIQFAAQAVLGSAKMVLDTNLHPAVLKDRVCSPAGTTIEAVSVLEKTGFRSSILEAMDACAKKSRGM